MSFFAGSSCLTISGGTFTNINLQTRDVGRCSSRNSDGLMNFDIETGDRGMEILNRLCQQLFSGANSILYDDSPKRKFDVYDREGLSTVTLEDAEGTSNLSESEAISNPSSSTEKSKSSPTPRREVWWLDLGTTNQCLESIKQCFEDCLDRFLISSSKSLLRRIRSPDDSNLRRNLHQCPGYLREEITLTSDISRSAIVSHVFPSQSELCSICGQLVQYAYSDPSITDEERSPLATHVRLNGNHTTKRPTTPTTAVRPVKQHDPPTSNSIAPPSSDVAAANTTSVTTAQTGSPSTWPPQWLSGAMQAMRSKYPMDRFEVTLRTVNTTSTPEWRIKCQDCPGRLYAPGPGETLSNYEVHLNNRFHRQHERLRNIPAPS